LRALVSAICSPSSLSSLGRGPWREAEHGEVRKQSRSAAHRVSRAIEREYNTFSGNHPNRSHIPYVSWRGNHFTLGAIPSIDPLNLGGHFDTSSVCAIGTLAYSCISFGTFVNPKSL